MVFINGWFCIVTQLFIKSFQGHALIGVCRDKCCSPWCLLGGLSCDGRGDFSESSSIVYPFGNLIKFLTKILDHFLIKNLERSCKILDTRFLQDLTRSCKILTKIIQELVRFLTKILTNLVRTLPRFYKIL